MSTTPEEMLAENVLSREEVRCYLPCRTCIVCHDSWTSGEKPRHQNACPVPAALAAAREEGRAVAQPALDHARHALMHVTLSSQMAPCGSLRSVLESAVAEIDELEGGPTVAEYVAEARAEARREVAEELWAAFDALRDEDTYETERGATVLDWEAFMAMMAAVPRPAPLVPKEGT